MTPTPINELTAKLASTTYPMAAEEVVSSPKVEEVDDRFSDSSSDLELCCDEEWLAYKRLPEKEPEWDVDSFDGREFRDYPNVRRLFPTQQLYDDYLDERLKAFASKGFLPDPLSDIFEIYLDGPKKGYNTCRDFIAELTNVCVKKFNETKVKTLELVNVLRATHSGIAKWKVYVTFMAREYHEGPLVEYQAKVIYCFGNDDQPPFPILCRPSPKPDSQN
ncbi:unnamed protein product [Microthlaspi erraticum]|uniref:Cystatin domain-containing protein n=1 Tax=Microthlaspi erraticum TaxID=1685480 RepID=A0A6D2KEM0_9BRAS|nr:unnamed protein product [Microthlaspi erraticum]